MLAKLHTFALVGIDALPVVAEVDASPSSLPKTILVGLPEAAVRESVHRVERAMVNLGYRRHPGRAVINLAPAELKKDAGAFDLPIALALLAAPGQIPASSFDNVAIAGELALDGTVRPIRGALSMAMSAASRQVPRLLVPLPSAREAATRRRPARSAWPTTASCSSTSFRSSTARAWRRRGINTPPAVPHADVAPKPNGGSLLTVHCRPAVRAGIDPAGRPGNPEGGDIVPGRT